MKFGTYICNDKLKQSRRGAIANFVFERKYMENLKITEISDNHFWENNFTSQISIFFL